MDTSNPLTLLRVQRECGDVRFEVGGRSCGRDLGEEKYLPGYGSEAQGRVFSSDFTDRILGVEDDDVSAVESIAIAVLSDRFLDGEVSVWWGKRGGPGCAEERW